MTIDQLINELTHIKKQHGGSVKVKIYIDGIDDLVLVNYLELVTDKDGNLCVEVA